MPLGDIDVAVGGEGNHHGLPQQSLSRSFIPIASASRLADCEEQLALRTELHHRGAMRGRDPDVVLGIDRHAVRLVLIADHIRVDLHDEAVVRQIDLEELRLTGLGTLKHPEVVVRIEGHSRHTAQTGGQYVGIGECVSQRLFPLHTLEALTPAAHPTATDR